LLQINIPATNPVVKSLPYTLGPNRDPDGNTFGVDSVSMTMNGAPWYVIAGEIHFTRLPVSTWKEGLQRMKAGGLNTISVYIFWIHHEEAEGDFVFEGRRDVNAFFEIVKAVGLKALIRIGPFNHGEVRNGGIPDWALHTSPGTAVIPFWRRLAAELHGMFFADGGPIVGVQLDNESSDWKYLLQLHATALNASFNPATFTRTGWPAMPKDAPADLPLLPFYGFYPDNFWSNDMAPVPNSHAYEFGLGPGDGGPIPAGFPWLDVELGGGMTAAYNHRTRMSPADMPSMHMVSVANGVNCLGYYMYHGGNNPHSLTADDSPEHTLQESSFQPSYAGNPLPSMSYDFFAPLGEFGQPRPHYHMMRRIHLFLQDFGGGNITTTADGGNDGGGLTRMLFAAPQSQTPLRWGVRHATSEVSARTNGYLFVNNYARLVNETAKTDLRFALKFVADSSLGDASMYIPSINSSEVTVGSGLWFVWPFNLHVPSSAGSSSGAGVTISYATADLLCKLDGVSAANSGEVGAGRSFLVFAATEGVAAEVAVQAEVGVQVLPGRGGTVTHEGRLLVVRGVTPSTGAALTISKTSSDSSDRCSVTVIILPSTLANRVWKGHFAGRERIFISPEGMEFVLTEATAGALLLRANTSDASSSTSSSSSTHKQAPLLLPLSMFPYTPVAPCGDHSTATATADPLPTTADGVFTKVVDIPFEIPVGLSATWHQLKAAPMPPKPVKKNSKTNKAQEPTAEEWATYAAVWQVQLKGAWEQYSSGDSASNITELRLAMRYRGDCARFCFTPSGGDSNRTGCMLLTDNWYSGYVGHGQMEVGLSALAAENPGLLAPSGNLTLHVMPLAKATVDSMIYMQQGHWPAFKEGGGDVAIGLDAVDVLSLSGISLQPAQGSRWE
jgi:hypothetical protein